MVARWKFFRPGVGGRLLREYLALPQCRAGAGRSAAWLARSESRDSQRFCGGSTWRNYGPGGIWADGVQHREQADQHGRDDHRDDDPLGADAGGEHRQQSVENSLNAITAAPDDIILVHDAVRPLVTPEIIHDVIEAAKKYGAAIAGLPAIDTVKQVERTAEGAIVKATIPRAGVVLAQTPQGFQYSVIKKAFDEAAADGFLGTDEASLAERSGHEVAVVMGSPSNIKITSPGDMELAEFYLSRR